MAFRPKLSIAVAWEPLTINDTLQQRSGQLRKNAMSVGFVISQNALSGGLNLGGIHPCTGLRCFMPLGMFCARMRPTVL